MYLWEFLNSEKGKISLFGTSLQNAGKKTQVDKIFKQTKTKT